jgi:hypothetical protein
VIFSSNIIKTSKSSRDSIEKQEKKEKKERKGKREKKAPGISSNKRGSQYFDRRKTLQLQKSFMM